MFVNLFQKVIAKTFLKKKSQNEDKIATPVAIMIPAKKKKEIMQS